MIFRPIIEIEGTITSVWNGTAKSGEPITLAEFINREDGKRYVLTSLLPLKVGFFEGVITQNKSQLSFMVLPITREELAGDRKRAEEAFGANSE